MAEAQNISAKENTRLRIGYAGFLRSHTPGEEADTLLSRIKSWFWDYRVRNIQEFTRSGYFILKGFQRLKEKYPEVAEQVELNWWGMIQPKNVEQAKAFGVEDMVVTEAYFSKDESHRKLQACDLLFLPMETPKDGQDPLFIPGKLYEYLKFQKPILGLGTQSDCANILKRSGMGVIVDPFDPDAIAEQLKFLVENKHRLEELFRPDLDYIQTNFSFENLTKRLSNIFQEVLETA